MKIRKNIRGKVLLICLLSAMILLSGCMTTSIEKVKNSDYVGRTVAVSGTVQNTIKIGDLSGFTIKDATDTISVSSESLPEEGTKITVRGTLVQDSILGYYIKVN